MDKNFTEFFYENEFKEKKSLVRLPDEERAKELKQQKRRELSAIQRKIKSGKISQEQYDGYRFEFEMWEFFYSLSPSWIDNPCKDFIIDLAAYKADWEKDELRPHQTGKQIDNFAIIGKHILISECKYTAGDKSSEKLSKDISLMQQLNQYKVKRLKKLFGDDYIPVFLLCLKGFKVESEEQIKNLQENNIIIFSEREKSYLEEVLKVSASPEFTFNQFLGFFRQGKPDFNIEKINKRGQRQKQKFKINAFSSNSGGGRKQNVFTFSISPRDMLQISTVSHQKSKNIYEATGVNKKYYQRLLTAKRLKQIGEHLSINKTPFPNNILVSYRGKSELEFKAGAKDKDFNVGREAGTLEFNACPGTFHVIDGQHRLFGYTNVDDRPGGLRDTHRLIVTAFKDLTVDEEAEIFLEVNQSSQKVKNDLIMEIEYAGDGESLSNLCNGIVFNLRDNSDSALYKKIAQAEQKGGDLKPTDLKTSIKELYMITGARSDFRQGLFWENGHRESASRASEYISSMLDILLKTNGYWFNENKQTQEKGFLQNILMKGVLHVIDRITIYNKERYPLETLENIIDRSHNMMRVFCQNLKKNKSKSIDVFNVKRFGLGSQGGRVACSWLVKEYLARDFSGIVLEDDESRIKSMNPAQHDKETQRILTEFETYKKRLKTEKTEAERAQLIEEIFFMKINAIFVKIFGEDYWNKMIEEHFEELYDQARSKRKDRRDYLEKNNDPDIEKGLRDYNIQWLEWSGIITILEEIHNKPEKYSQYVKNIFSSSQEYEDLPGLIKYLFFASSTKPRSKLSFKEGINWMRFFNELRKSPGHPRGKDLTTPTEAKEFNKIEEKIMTKLEMMSLFIQT